MEQNTIRRLQGFFLIRQTFEFATHLTSFFMGGWLHELKYCKVLCCLMLTSTIAFADLVELNKLRKVGSKTVDCPRNIRTDICKGSEVMDTLMEGVDKAIRECRTQFQNERWNCDVTDLGNFNTFVTKGYRETAIVYALVGAGAAHEIATDCSYGSRHLERPCPCQDAGNTYSENGDFKWGCHDNVDYGIRMASQVFMVLQASGEERLIKEGNHSTREINALSLMNLHNYDVGMMTVKSLSQREIRCACKSTSGTCIYKVCWKVLPRFPLVAAKLVEHYNSAVKVAKKTKLRLRKRGTMNAQVNAESLVYTQNSPSFCDSDPSQGISGVGGRTCRVGSAAHDSCSILCCERGYDTVQKRTFDQCRCVFQWCCEVTCEKCNERSETITTCKKETREYAHTPRMRHGHAQNTR